jgi:hypothetical protein
MNKQSWHLRDAEKLHRKNPYTFYKPGEDIISKLKPGDHVRLIFGFEPQAEDGCAAERMWVTIKTQKDGYFEGALDNNPLYINGLKLGDTIKLSSKHIIDTNYTDPKDKELDEFFKLCLVTESILNGDKVGLLQRFEPNNEKDSGWCFSGDFDTQEYLDNSDNIKIVSLGVLLNIDDSFLHLLEYPIGASFEWDRSEQRYMPFECEND